VGVYVIAEGKRRRYFAVNLVNAHESDISGPDMIKPEKETTEDGRTETLQTMRLLWPYLLLLGCVSLFLEWYFWCKTRT
jgi:hypothetical protein